MPFCAFNEAAIYSFWGVDSGSIWRRVEPVGLRVRVAVRVRGSRLFLQFSDWKDEVEAFPETETRFFVPDVYAEITFEKDTAGNANSLVVHHEDQPDWRASRVQ